jgi:hypothetical protein
MSEMNETRREQARQEQLAFLHDPQTLAREFYEYVFMANEVDRLFMGDSPRDGYRNRAEAFALIRLAATTPAETIARAIGRTQDVCNNLGLAREHQGIAMGVVLEQLRCALIDCLAELDRPADPGGSDAEGLRAMRAEIEAVALGETEAAS